MKQICFGLILAALSARAAAPPDAEIAKLRQAWSEYLRAKQVDQAVSLYTPDAIFFLPQGGHMDGVAEIRKLYNTITQTFDSDIQLHSKWLEVSGNLACDSGDYQETLVTRSTGAKIESHGSYLMVLRRDAGGTWKIAQHMWTGVPPAQ